MATQKAKNDQIWLAVVHVKPMPSDETLGEAAGAHAGVFGLGSDQSMFEFSVAKLVSALGFILVEIDDVELVSIREFKRRVSKEIYSIALELNDGAPVGYGSFYTYTDE